MATGRRTRDVAVVRDLDGHALQLDLVVVQQHRALLLAAVAEWSIHRRRFTLHMATEERLVDCSSVLSGADGQYGVLTWHAYQQMLA